MSNSDRPVLDCAGWEQQQWLDEYRAYTEEHDMGIIAKGQDFENPEPGTHVARCYRVIDLGTQFNERWNTRQRKTLIGWELPNDMMKDGTPFLIACRYTVSLSEKAYLRRDLESWRGRKFTAEELQGFDLDNVVGVPCLLGIVISEDGYANVTSVAPMMKGQQCPPPITKPQTFDIYNPDMEVMASLSEKMRTIIESSEEWKGRSTAVADSGRPTVAEPDFDDDIPF
jgi:hypothetical protein